jgi:hypothetical protein
MKKAVDFGVEHEYGKRRFLMAEKQIVCDSCGERWEESFFCKECSSGGRYEIHEVPNIIWGGLPSEEYVWEEEWFSYGDICLNCCGGHPRSP